MKMTAVMVAIYILDCCLIGTRPCKYFQLNSPYFNEEKGVFSKMDLDRLIPDRWRLRQVYDDGLFVPERFPVFVKPEWGQNAGGIYRADSREQLDSIRRKISRSKAPYLIQYCADHSREFEIFSLLDYRDKSNFSVFSVTEVINENESNPINGIHNPHTRYIDITEQLSENQKQALFSFIGRIGRFSISRLSASADGVENLAAGDFQVIEINLFTPMPIHMLDSRCTLRKTGKLIREYMMLLARLTKARDKTRKEKPVFTKTVFYNRESALADFIRERI